MEFKIKTGDLATHKTPLSDTRDLRETQALGPSRADRRGQ